MNEMRRGGGRGEFASLDPEVPDFCVSCAYGHLTTLPLRARISIPVANTFVQRMGG